MRVSTISIFAACYLLLTIFACQAELRPTDDDDESMGPVEITEYTNGIFIANQGSPADGISGTISFFDRSSSQVVEEIYQKENGGKVLGDKVNQINIHRNTAYILVEGADKLELANAESFEEQGAIGGFARPKFFLPVSISKAYVSQFGSDGYTGSVQVVDLNDKKIVKEISTRGGSGRMIKNGDFVYLLNNGGFALDSVITKIDITNDQVAKTIEVGPAPNSIVSDKNNHIWVLSQGAVNLGDRSKDIPGRLVRIEGDQVKFSLPLKAGASSLVISKGGDKLYFINDNWVYAFDITDTQLTNSPFIATAYTQLAIDPYDGSLVAANSQNLQVPGSVYIFDSRGKELNSFGVGIFPNAFWFE